MAPNVFGFSGGSIQDAIKPHLKAKSILSVDFKDAFPTITSENVFDYLTAGRAVWTTGGWGHNRRIVEIKHGRFSWYAARILTELTTFQGKLPQGAPTSPWLFDLICKKVDEGLLKLAGNVNGAYTRYADNVFFSVKQEEFPRPIRQAILKLIEDRKWQVSRKHKRAGGPCFNWHKLKVRKISRESLRLLGLNMIGGEIHNTRAFKRRVRLTIYHIKWLLDQGMMDTPELKKAWKILQGQMSFAEINTLPQKLLDAYQALEKNFIKTLRFFRKKNRSVFLSLAAIPRASCPGLFGLVFFLLHPLSPSLCNIISDRQLYDYFTN